MEELLALFLILFVIVAVCAGFWWIVGGIHLDYLRQEAPTRLQDYDFVDCVYDGYSRTLFSGFGGRVHYLCLKDGIYYGVRFARRINNSELQMYGPDQYTTFPANFKINNQ